MIDLNRVRQLNKIDFLDKPGVVVYWMNRDQRITDNWAFHLTQEIAIKHQLPMIVVFEYVPNYNAVRSRIYRFMLEGLSQVEKELNSLNIPLVVLESGTEKNIVEFVNKYNIFTLVTDFSPLNSVTKNKDSVRANIKVPFFEVDTHNIVPCWLASDKAEYGAYTFRPKIMSLLSQYLTDFPLPKIHPYELADKMPPHDWSKIIKSNTHDDVTPINKLFPSGGKNGLARLEEFIAYGLNDYSKNHNNPNLNGQSNLSPYLHFGQISPQRVAYIIENNQNIDPASKAEFLEELIVRRELADNFCYYNQNYDLINAFPNWAQKTLESHHFDKREYIYKLPDFEAGKTHDPLWNAAQLEMVKTGKMHGYMRMYWAKKILEWSASAYDALQIAINLNDKYSLDGTDPNGYTGIAWSIGGVHDRPWFERPIFGQIRYMNYEGSSSKFDVKKYIEKINNL